MKKVIALVVVCMLSFVSFASAFELRENEKAINANETSRLNPAALDSSVFASAIEENGIMYVLCLRLEKVEISDSNLIFYFYSGFSKTRPEQDIELYLMSDDFALVSGGKVVADAADAVLFADDTDVDYWGQMISGYPDSAFNIKVVFTDCAEYADSALLRYQSAFLSIMYAYQPKIIALNTAWFITK